MIAPKTSVASASSSRLVRVFAREALNLRSPPLLPLPRAATLLPPVRLSVAGSSAAGNSRQSIRAVRQRDLRQSPAFVLVVTPPTTCRPSHIVFYRRGPPLMPHQRD